MPDTAEYLARIREHAPSGDPVELQQRTPGILAELIGEVPLERLTTRPAEDK